ncbi:RNA 2',3'-cyclic phosphodiesterase [Candidatus Micrarchaeota archaeon]|nr:RNA 2',3'-cyclic phosphodiesterase [Candidatus Micrarchaeota archaeon]
MRLFIAIDLPDEIERKLEQLTHQAKRLDLHASFSKPEQLHVTLLFLGERTEEEAQQIKEKLVQFQFPKFRLQVEGSGFFPSEDYIKVFWVGVHGTEEQLQKMHEKMSELLEEPFRGPYVGHVTISRVKGKKNVDKLKQLKHALEQEKYGEFEVKEFILRKSTLSPRGAVYEDLNTFSLQ